MAWEVMAWEASSQAIFLTISLRRCGRSARTAYSAMRSVVVVPMVTVAIAAILVPMSVIAMVVVTVIALLMAGTIAGLVLRGSHEIHRSVAGIVLVTMLAPVLGMTRRHVQIERLHRHRLSHHRRHGDDRLRVHERRWRPVTQHHVAIHTGNDLAGDGRIDTHILRLGQGHDRRQGQRRLQHETNRSHKLSPQDVIVRTHGAHYANPYRE